MGFVMGTGVGLTIGFIFGSYSILRCVAMPYIVYFKDADIVAEEGQVLAVFWPLYLSTC